MLKPIKIINIELSTPLKSIENLNGYMGVQGLVRFYGAPIGYVRLPVLNNRCPVEIQSKIILAKHSHTIIRRILRSGLAASTPPENFQLETLFSVPPQKQAKPLPLVTVAVCTRDRTADLALCLDALSHLDYPHLDILVVDNAPTNDQTAQLVQSYYPTIRYVCEPRPGLNWARNRAALEARGEIIAYTDDDVLVDPGWITAIASVFAENPQVTVVTGLVVPYELETEAQILFEMNGGFGRGFERKWVQLSHTNGKQFGYQATGQFGTGANMAFRRSAFDKIGYFDPALDVGTVTNGCGDLEMFFRVLKAGCVLVYEPRAIVWHRHRRKYQQLRNQVSNNGSVYSYFVCAAKAHPDERFNFLKLGIWWFWSMLLLRLAGSLLGFIRFPPDLILAEIKGYLVGLTRYQHAKRNAARITDTFGELTPSVPPFPQPKSSKTALVSKANVVVRTVELSQPLQPLTDVASFSKVNIRYEWKGSLWGCVEITNNYQQVGVGRLGDLAIECLDMEFIARQSQLSKEHWEADLLGQLSQKLGQSSDGETDEQDGPLSTLPDSVSVSVVVKGRNNPHNLRKCLTCLLAQTIPNPVEIIVVNDNPNAALIQAVAVDFPAVMLVNAAPPGTAYSRNAGIAASTGDIVVVINDDMTMPADWLKTLLAPFTRADVMITAGNIQLSEEKNMVSGPTSFSCNFGADKFKITASWFKSKQGQTAATVPTWRLTVNRIYQYLQSNWRTLHLIIQPWRRGFTGNLAFRASIFQHPHIGFVDETLGQNLSSGAGEEMYILYKTVDAGYTIVHQPAACTTISPNSADYRSVLHYHHYNYGKVLVNYYLTALFHDKDLRMLFLMPTQLGWRYTQRLVNQLFRRNNEPLSFILIELAGNLAGLWSFLCGRRHVNKSVSYTPIAQRSPKQRLSQAKR